MNPGPWPPPSATPSEPPPPAAEPGASGLVRAAQVLLVLMVVAALVVLAVQLRRDGPEEDVVPVRGGAASAASAPTTAALAPSTTAPPSTTATTARATTTTSPTTTTVPATTTTTVPATTTTTAPAPAPTTAAPAVTPPDVPAASVLLSEELAPDALGAVEDARAIAAALAEGDWAEARRLGPTDRARTDAQLERGYGAATDITLVPARIVDNGARTDLRLGLVTHEEHPTGPATAVMCAHWQVDDASRQVHRISSVRLRLEPGLIDPVTVADELRATCATVRLR